MKKVLILMPVLNGARYLDAAITSVRRQSYQNWRLVILDAGSSDSSEKIASDHASEDRRIELVRREDQGIYDALAYGFETYDGDILCWLNSDDLFTPWALSTAVLNLSNAGVSWLNGLPALWDTAGNLVTVYPRGRPSQRRIAAGWHHDAFLGCLQQEGMFWSRDLYAKLSENELTSFRKSQLAGDFLLWKCFAKHAPLHIASTVLSGYRVHSDNRGINEIDTYQREVEELGGYSPLPIFARVLRKAYDIRKALSAMREAHTAAHQLHRARKS